MTKTVAPPFEFVAKRKDGEKFPAEIETRDFKKDEERFRVSAIRDITKRKTIEAQNQQMARLADLGEMASGVAHEINNPISGVINCAELLKGKLPAEDERQGIADRIIHEGLRIANIVKALLTIAHPGSSKEKINVEESINTVLALFEHKLESAGVHVSVEAAGDLPQIKGDRQKIEQVLLNLISNSYDALNAKFPEPGPEKDLKIRIYADKEDGRELLFVEIHDQGGGIPKEIIGRIFDPFFTTKPAGSGTGIGLGFCYQIINSHGGDIRVESEEGKYAQFTIELPTNTL
jgi:signal transduction histidine kinase